MKGPSYSPGFHCARGLPDCLRGLLANRTAYYGAPVTRQRPADGLCRRKDIHRATAAEVFGLPLESVTNEQRRSAKAINFGLIYGMSAFGLSRQLNIPRKESQKYMDLYFERYPGVLEYMERTRAQAKEKGYVETLDGRRLYLPDIKSSNAARRAGAERAAINAPMQGTAADIIKRAMIAVDARLEKRNRA